MIQVQRCLRNILDYTVDILYHTLLQVNLWQYLLDIELELLILKLSNFRLGIGLEYMSQLDNNILQHNLNSHLMNPNQDYKYILKLNSLLVHLYLKVLLSNNIFLMGIYNLNLFRKFQLEEVLLLHHHKYVLIHNNQIPWFHQYNIV